MSKRSSAGVSAKRVSLPKQLLEPCNTQQFSWEEDKEDQLNEAFVSSHHSQKRHPLTSTPCSPKQRKVKAVHGNIYETDDEDVLAVEPSEKKSFNWKAKPLQEKRVFAKTPAPSSVSSDEGVDDGGCSAADDSIVRAMKLQKKARSGRYGRKYGHVNAQKVDMFVRPKKRLVGKDYKCNNPTEDAFFSKQYSYQVNNLMIRRSNLAGVGHYLHFLSVKKNDQGGIRFDKRFSCSAFNINGMMTALKDLKEEIDGYTSE